MEAVFTPRQVATALGVSESTIKRWVDSGRLRATKTLGGHRKLPQGAIVSFVRATGQQIADPELLGLVANAGSLDPESLQDELYDRLTDGDEPAVRGIMVRLYQNGLPIADLGDRLLSPVFRRIGQQWAAGELQMHHERRACTTVLAVLHEIRQWIAPPEPDAPLALCASPYTDYAQTPLWLLELTLLNAGWNACAAGAGLPLDQIYNAVQLHRPRLICLSATHVPHLPTFVKEVNEVLADELSANVSLVIGGCAVEGVRTTELRCDLLASCLADLELYLAKIGNAGVARVGV
ncbi:Helix-turn-helix domain protein [Posidoniimonas polymericola]|uniref:Helix-turn-helix domain protein n=1 Tax=Posidoniimonas polymericola TaxID=2528002 RepID=A0A5C5YQX6_9BACT|nr:helix-turn-helix domain-containing protein [Posidoniimonas polymericola]TWT77147.1 Helix-turn-helix domain protein [Posidoniimonas polymericola]